MLKLSNYQLLNSVNVFNSLHVEYDKLDVEEPIRPVLFLELVWVVFSSHFSLPFSPPGHKVRCLDTDYFADSVLSHRIFFNSSAFFR